MKPDFFFQILNEMVILDLYRQNLKRKFKIHMCIETANPYADLFKGIWKISFYWIRWWR